MPLSGMQLVLGSVLAGAIVATVSLVYWTFLKH